MLNLNGVRRCSRHAYRAAATLILGSGGAAATLILNGGLEGSGVQPPPEARGSRPTVSVKVQFCSGPGSRLQIRGPTFPRCSSAACQWMRDERACSIRCRFPMSAGNQISLYGGPVRSVNRSRSGRRQPRTSAKQRRTWTTVPQRSTTDRSRRAEDVRGLPAKLGPFRIVPSMPVVQNFNTSKTMPAIGPARILHLQELP